MRIDAFICRSNMTKREFGKLSQSEKIGFLKRNIGEFGKFSNLCDFSYTAWEDILGELPVCVLKSTTLPIFNARFAAAKAAVSGEINKNDAENFCFSDWEFLLNRRPECASVALDYPAGGIIALLKNPENANNFQNWIKFDIAHWEFLLRKEPSFEKFAKQYPRGRICLYKKGVGADGIILPDDAKTYDWDALKVLYPRMAAKYGNWDEIELFDWIQILGKYPEFSLRFDKWGELNYDKWVQLFTAFTGREFYESLAKNYHSGWAGILCLKPELVSGCNMLEELTAEDWVGVLRFKPRLIKYCNKYREIPHDDLVELFNYYADGLEMSLENFKKWSEEGDI